MEKLQRVHSHITINKGVGSQTILIKRLIELDIFSLEKRRLAGEQGAVLDIIAVAKIFESQRRGLKTVLTCHWQQGTDQQL